MTETESLASLLANPAVSIIVHAAKNTIPLDTDTLTLGSFVECDFPGYAPIANPGFQALPSDNDAYAEYLSDPVRFTADALTNPEEITALYVGVINGSNPEVLLWPFPLPESAYLGVEGDFFEQQIRVTSFAGIPV